MATGTTGEGYQKVSLPARLAACSPVASSEKSVTSAARGTLQTLGFASWAPTRRGNEPTIRGSDEGLLCQVASEPLRWAPSPSHGTGSGEPRAGRPVHITVALPGTLPWMRGPVELGAGVCGRGAA